MVFIYEKYNVKYLYRGVFMVVYLGYIIDIF